MPYLGYSLILLICAGVIYLALTKERLRAYPVFLYLAGLGMILTTSLAGSYLGGSDIHLEYYYAQLHLGINVLPPVVGAPQGTSIGNTVLAPLLGRIIPLLWIYKLVFPILFAFVPVIMYFVFRKWFMARQAFLASFVVIAFTPFFMELPTIVRHMTAEIVVVGLLYIIFKSTLLNKYAIPLTTGLGALAALSYYTVTIVSLFMLSTITLVGLLLRRKRLLLLVCMTTMVVTGSIYYPLVEDGAVAVKLGRTYNAYAPKMLQLPVPDMRVPAKVNPNPVVEYTEEAGGETATVSPPKVSANPYIKRLGVMTNSGLGLDWNEQNIWGRAFRVLQWLFLLLIPMGLWKLRRNRKYLMVASGGLLLLSLLLVPGFMGLLSVTRVVHISLLVLAPAVAVSLKPKYLLVVLIPYFLFASGFVFEATQQPNIEEITIPYNYGLSNRRIDLGIGASITDDDYRVRQYIYDNSLYPVYSDTQGADFMGELTGWRPFNSRAFYEKTTLPEETIYVFVYSRVTQDGLFTAWRRPGCRVRITPQSLGIDINKNIIYQSGDARVLKVGE